MLGLDVIVAVGLAILGCGVLGRRLHIAPALLLLATGAMLGFIPALRTVTLPPTVVLLLFLPALLYWESITTSLRVIRSNLRGIVLASTVLVIASAAAVALTAHAVGVAWGAAWVLGAAVAPTDATAVGQFAGFLPYRAITILRAESLINDGTALVVFSVAAGVTVGGEHLEFGNVAGRFALSYLGGAFAGVVVALVVGPVRRRLADPLLNNVAVLITPFAAFLLAQAVRASGVLAVVVCGLIMARVGPRVGHAAARRQTEAFWSLATFVLNGALFALIGLESQSAARGLSTGDLGEALEIVAVVTVVLATVRLVFFVVTAYLIRAIDRRPEQRRRRMTNRARAVLAVGGFRGAVSLAVALSIPVRLNSGRPFPDRGTIVFATFGVIVVTLVVQGLALRPIARWADLPGGTDLGEERRLAELTATERALEALPGVAERLGTNQVVADRLRHEYQKRLRVIRAAEQEPFDEEAVRYDRDYTALRLALLDHKREAILGLRRDGRIDDSVLLQLQASLDIEEVRLNRSVTFE